MILMFNLRNTLPFSPFPLRLHESQPTLLDFLYPSLSSNHRKWITENPPQRTSKSFDFPHLLTSDRHFNIGLLHILLGVEKSFLLNPESLEYVCACCFCL